MAQYATYGDMRSSHGLQGNASSSNLAQSYRRGGSDDSAGSVDITVKRDLEDDDDGGVGDEELEGRPKKILKRGAKACTACRKVKMRCIASDPPESRCRRCSGGAYECVFIESQRGRHKTRTSDIMAAKLKQMQHTLDTVLHTIGGAPPAAPPAPQFTLDGANPHLPSLSLSPEMSHPRSRQKSLTAVPVNPHHLLDSVSTELDRYAPPHDGPDHNGTAPFGNLQVLGGSSDGSVQTPGHLDAHATKQAKLAAGSFAGDPIKFPLRKQEAEPKTAPALLLEKIVTVEEVTMLFDLFFDFCQPQAPFLDRGLHTPTYTALYAPFLFTCICTVASRYVSSRPGLYAQCRATAIRLAAENVFSGLTSISIVQGCLILAHWNQPGYPTEGDRCYLFCGLAVRMSLELGLHVKTDVQIPPGETEELRSMYEKDARNRERTWIHCVVTDRSLSLQMGKPSCISKEDYIIKNVTPWSTHPLAIGSDVGICSIMELHKIIAQAIDAFYSDANSYTGANEYLDYASTVRVFLAQTEHWKSTTLAIIREHIRDDDLEFRSAMMNLYFSYYRVFILSFAIQYAHDKPQLHQDLTFYVAKGYESAVTLVKLVKEKLGDTGRFRYGMDSTFVYVTYCATFLLKLTHPSFASIVDPTVAIATARDVATLLEKAAVDDAHTPAIYAAFLRSLIDSKVSGERTTAVTRAGSRAGSPSLEGTRLLPDLTASLQEILDANAADDAALGLNATGDALNNSGFWENMLMPGFGGRLGTLSGGGAMLSNNNAFEGWGEPAMFSRAGSPQPFSDFIFAAGE